MENNFFEKKSIKFKSLVAILVLSLLILLVFSPQKGHATNLNFIDMDLFIDGFGTGHISMEWNYYDDQGTEHFIPINTDGIAIENLKVSKNGLDYKILDSWDVNASREDKANKAGILNKPDGIEICWGIGEYGDNSFKISYEIVDIIKAIEDGQILHYRFVNDGLSEPPEKVELRIRGEKDFTSEILMWAFGLDGQINLKNSSIVLKSNKALDSKDYVHVLLKFPIDYFNLSENSYMDKSFEEVKEEAFQGSDYLIDPDGVQEIESEPMSLLQVLGIIFLPLIILVTSIVAIFRGSKLNSIQIDKSKLKGEYHSHIPYEGDPLDLFYILKNIGLSDYKSIVNYYFLKWIKDEVLVKVDYESGKIFKKEKSALKISKQPESKDNFELEFFNMVKESAGSDSILQEDEFTNWMSKHYSRFDSFMSRLEEDSKKILIDKSYLKHKETKIIFSKAKEINVSDKGMELTENLVKFKNYLYDYSLLNERDSYNVHIWDDLMLYASLFGITDRVKKEFDKLAPQYVKETQFDFTSFYLINMYSNSFIRSYENSTAASSLSASSGFGGGTSFGGGGGGFGGGSGGGTR